MQVEESTFRSLSQAPVRTRSQAVQRLVLYKADLLRRKKQHLARFLGLGWSQNTIASAEGDTIDPNLTYNCLEM